MKRLKIKNIIIALFILILIPIFISRFISNAKYKNSNFYKLEVLGYNSEEIEKIKELEDDFVVYFLENEYEPIKIEFINSKYFIFDNLDKYIEYYKSTYKEINEVISLVNTNAYRDFYEDIEKTDITKDTLILVNKFNKLPSDFSPNDLVQINLQFAYDNNRLTEEAAKKFIEMANYAKSNHNLNLIATSSYRSYEVQERLYERYKSLHGQREADTFSARAGHSEHQTGLAVDIITVGVTMRDFFKTKEYEFLKDNSWKFGFILRYPEKKEHITGYMFEPWHYRYVGKEVSEYIYENDITFDEYYSYYLR